MKEQVRCECSKVQIVGQQRLKYVEESCKAAGRLRYGVCNWSLDAEAVSEGQVLPSTAMRTAQPDGKSGNLQSRDI